MSNLIKSNYVKYTPQNIWTIDSDSRKTAINLPAFSDAEKGRSNFEDFVQGIPAVRQEDIANQDVDTQQEADEIIENAKKQAEEILMQAQNEAEQNKMEIYENVRREAYETAVKEAEKEIEQKQMELQQEKMKLEEDYQQKLEQMEPVIVELLIDYLKKITGIMAQDHKEIINYLVDSALHGAGKSKLYQIKVSPADFKMVQEHKAEFNEIVGQQAQLEFLEDTDLKQNDCLIETDTRIINSSMQIQLDNLITDLKLLANL